MRWPLLLLLPAEPCQVKLFWQLPARPDNGPRLMSNSSARLQQKGPGSCSLQPAMPNSHSQLQPSTPNLMFELVPTWACLTFLVIMVTLRQHLREQGWGGE